MFETMPDFGTDRVLSGEALQVLLWLGNQIPGGFFIYRADESQEIVYVNRSVLDIFGCETREAFNALTGNTFRGLVHPDDYDEVQTSIENQIADGANSHMDHVEYRITRRNGEIRWLDDYGRFAQMPGYGDVYYVFIMDITDKRRAQEEKLRMELELARERHANEVKTNFLFNMSHDIRTPMNAIIGFSELAKRHRDDPDLLQTYLDKALASGRQMLSLIDDMLEMNRLESGKVRLGQEVADLREQIGMVVDMFRLEAGEKGVALREALDLPDEAVILDRSRFRRVIGNLLSNAVKFTPPGGMVTVRARRVSASESGFARYEFRVEDTGVGISRDFMKRIYDCFEREATSTQTGNTGAGLGLPIVKSLLDLMGGTVTAASEKGRGSTFTVELPLKLADGATPAAPEQADDRPEAVRAMGEKRILIVEDIEFNRDIAEALLEEAGFVVESVADGCDAVEAVKNHPAWHYDLVLMDIQMPVMNGYEATRAIRALPREDAKRLPIIALSANAREEDRRMSMESGMNCHVAKPFEIDPLVATINEYIARCGQ